MTATIREILTAKGSQVLELLEALATGEISTKQGAK